MGNYLRRIEEEGFEALTDSKAQKAQEAISELLKLYPDREIRIYPARKVDLHSGHVNPTTLIAVKKFPF